MIKAKALIIGNSNYSGNQLDNPINDATDIDEVLSRLGFKTTLITDADKITQDKVITEFATSLDNFDIGLFYFAGHGFQINNENYLAAIDTDFNDEEHAKHTAFPLDILLSYFGKSKNSTSIIILDACRELLKKKAWYRSVEDSGLAPIFAPKGTLIAYATSPGEKALDGTGQRNGIYTNALLQHITVENIPVEEMFKRVRNSVFAFSKGRQTSWEHTSLTGTFYFNSGQLAHSITIEYSQLAIQDGLYVANTSTLIDSIIKDLKSYNYYTQNPAIDKISQINVRTEDKNKLFILGRNILQAACGNSAAAIQFMDNLATNLPSLDIGHKNHVLNGIIYETFFNSYGSFRQDEIKSCYLSATYQLLEDKKYEESLKFLNLVLEPYRDIIFYIPSIHQSGISFDVELQKAGEEKYLLKTIRYEGNEVLRKQESNFSWERDNDQTYFGVNFKGLKRLISQEINTPENKLSINTNLMLDDNSRIDYPDNHRILK
ncbi:caspase family protein [Pontibacter arcticus]|uniref:Caspase family protein n=1 Tax=Pontibacter arcticus TaxID=2080288 RepID=A0A364RC35_9BACT|nr:caspase family protein [Pontibacter arcticus]RAU81881.1 caspase family protein [Pontibacter arcticus]